MILLLSEPKDDTVQVVYEKLQASGAEVLWFDNEDFPEKARLSWGASTNGSNNDGTRLHIGGKVYNLDKITSAWSRRPGISRASSEIKDEVTQGYVQQQSRQFLSDVWSNLDCLWIPGPRWNVRKAEQKNLQLKLAVEIGLEIPPTLITNSPEEFLDFYRSNNGNVISKPIRSGFVWRGEPYNSNVRAIAYTENVTNRDLGYASTIRYCPAIFQGYVPKRVELRITVVGQKVFAAEIHSQDNARTQHDWRHYDLHNTVHKRHELPDDISQMLVRLVERLGLCFGAADMVLTPEGRYVFLEINPNGQYGWIEYFTGLPISQAIADLLLSRENAGEK